MTIHQSSIVRQAQKVYARICKAIGYDLDMSDPGDMQTLLEYAGDDEDTLRRAVDLCKEEGTRFTGRSTEHGYGDTEPLNFGAQDDDSDFERYCEEGDEDADV